jgi:hypothetical protein
VSRPAYELADVVRRFGAGLHAARPLSAHVRRALDDIGRCRTAALGGHVDACDGCGSIRISYNSCRNRHCPKCQGVEREAWIAGQEENLQVKMKVKMVLEKLNQQVIQLLLKMLKNH